MPTDSRWFVKTAFVWLAIAFAAGAAMLVAKALGHAVPEIVAIEHAHVAFVGWLVNMVVGFALWMLPLNRERFPRSAGRSPAAPAMAAYALLNAGLVVRVVVEPLFDYGVAPRAASGLLIASSVAQLAAILLLLPLVWARVRPPSHPRPQ